MRVFVHDDFWTHWKLQRASLKLGMDSTHLGGCIVRLWCWTMRYRSEGNLDGLQGDEIAAAAGCPHPSLSDALRESGFIDEDSSIHDWAYWQGALLAKVNRDKKRRAEKAKASRSRRANAAPALRPTSVAVAVPTSVATPTAASVEQPAPLLMVDSDVQAVVNALGFIQRPKAAEKGRAIQDLKRQGVDLKAALDFFKGKARTWDFYEAVKELTPKVASSKKRRGGAILSEAEVAEMKAIDAKMEADHAQD